MPPAGVLRPYYWYVYLYQCDLCNLCYKMEVRRPVRCRLQFYEILRCLVIFKTMVSCIVMSTILV